MSNGTQRLNWLDAARLCAAFFIIAHHTAMDPYGKMFPAADDGERFFPAFFRVTSELATTEFFFLVSLFLLALKLEKAPRPFFPTMKTQSRRLLVPFAFWAAAYPFLALGKAYLEGQGIEYRWDMITEWEHWPGYLILGTSAIHLHFIPTLFLILVFHPIMRVALQFPILGLMVVPLLVMKYYIDIWLWKYVWEEGSVAFSYLFRANKVLGYVGYGFVAYALYGLYLKKFDNETWRKIGNFALLVAFMGYLIKLTFARELLDAGELVNRSGVFYWVHYLLPPFVFLIFMGHMGKEFWPPKFSLISKYSFGLYLLHPAVMMFESNLNELVGIYWDNMTPAELVFFRYFETCILTFAATILISKIKPIAWTVGLGNLPFFERNAK